MAAKLGKDEKVDEVVNGLVTDFQQWSHDKEAYAQAREQLAKLILILKK